MKYSTTNRGFGIVEHPSYLSQEVSRLVQSSSKIGDYEDAFDRPGTSALWIGEDHHLDREEVAKLVEHLQAWLTTGSLELPNTSPAAS